MKIVHVIGTLELASGGPAVGTTSFAAAESLLGHEVHIVCYDGPGHAEAMRFFCQYPCFNQVVVHAIPPGGVVEKSSAFSAISVFKEVLTADCLLVIQGVWRPILARAISLARARGLPYAIVPHGMLDSWSLKQKSWRKKVAWALAWKGYFNNATLIRILNVDEQRLMEPLHITAHMELAPNGVFPEEFAVLPAAGEFLSRHPQLNNRRYVLFLSRLHFKKGLDYLIEAFAIAAKEVSDVDLVIAGPDEGALKQLQQDIERLQLKERVHIVGPLYGRDKLSALVDAYCFCLPSRQEGFSIAITEALASGTPVVISENSNFPEVKDAHAGHVVKLDSTQVATALIDLLQSPAKRDSAGRAGRALIFERFTWQAIAANWCKRVEQLTAVSKGQSSAPR